MSSRRIVSSCAFMAAIVAAGSWYAVSAFPLQHSMTFVPAPQGGAGPLELRAQAITPENPVPRRVTSENMPYPAEAAAVEAGGTLTLQITLDESGRVAEARPVQVEFKSPVMGTSVSFKAGNEDLRSMFQRGSSRVPAQTAMIEVYDAVMGAATEAVKQWRYDPPFKAPISFPVSFRFGSDPPPVEMAFQARPTRTSIEGIVRVGDGGIGAPVKVKDVKPVYPPIAQAAGVQGIVMMEIRIEPDGTVGTATVMRSIPLLDGAALDAVKQWQFMPTLLNGQPVAVVMTVTINFSLGQAESVAPASAVADRADLVPSWAPGLEQTKSGSTYWSPDGTKLAFFSNRDGKPELYVVNRDGSGLRKVTTHSGQK